MGNNCVQQNREKKRKGSADRVPEGTEELRGQSLPELTFELAVSNVELRQHPLGKVGIRIDIEGILEWNYQKHNSNGTTHWKTERLMIIKATEYDFRKMFLNIHILDGTGAGIGNLSLNMFLVITGPWRHDFLIRYNQGASGKLSADIRCTQMIEVVMRPTMVKMNLSEEHPGEMFHFTLKKEDLSGKEDETGESYDVETFLYNKKRTYEMDSEGESATYKKRKTMILEFHKGLQWSSSISTRGYSRELPSLEFLIKADSISNYTFSFMLWKKSKDDDDTFELYGQTNIPLSKLFWNDTKDCQHNPEVGTIRDIQIQQKVEFMGKYCGTVSLRCKVETPKFFQQVLILTRTELGITQVRSHVGLEISNLQCQQVREIRKYKENILFEMLKSGNFKNDMTPNGIRQYQTHKSNVFDEIKKLEKLLREGNGESPTFEFHSEEDMLRAQNEMLDTINKLLPFTEAREVSIVQLSWQCLKALLLRGEFLLSNIGFKDKQIEAMSTTPRLKLKKHLQQKICTCENYQLSLVQLLSSALKKFGRKMQRDQLKFIFTLCTVAFFKIPPFRQQLLETIINVDDTPRKQCFKNSHNIKVFQKITDWEGKFVDLLKLYNSNQTQLGELLSLTHWKEVLKNRGSFFFMIIEGWATNAQAVLGSTDTSKYWSDIPGYQVIVGSFVKQMTSRSIVEYTDAMKDANMALLNNQCLLPVFLKILLQKTNVYEVSTALRCLELIGAYFSYFQYNNRQVPSCFDNKLFYMTIKGVMVGQNCFVIAKMLQILYMHFNIFGNQFKKEVSMLMLGMPFFTLMLNWARTVRQVFRYLVLYRILVWGKEKEMLDIATRWEELNDIMEDAQFTYTISSKNNFSFNFGKSYHQKLKAKLNSRNSILSPITLKKRAKSQMYEPVRTQSTQNHAPDIVLSPTQTEQADWNLLQRPERRVKFSQEIMAVTMTQTQIPRRSVDLNEKKSTRQRRVSLHLDFITPSISPEESNYIIVGLQQLATMQTELKVWLKQTKDLNKVPRVDIKIPIDQGDMRPDNLGGFQQ